jgi:hypothetical protein
MEEYDALMKKLKGLQDENLTLSYKLKKRTLKQGAKEALKAVIDSEKPLGEEKKPDSTKPEFVRRWEKTCPDCGGENPEYKEPNVFCNGPECKGVIPLGTIDKEKEPQKQVDEIKACWNCGAKGEELHVVVK